ncbi:MAG: hypothetical protein PHC33_03630 [Candidatus Omnitrophica bacterium]|nr:hypothetical protein [Candidatus Omnitrophota bacterium]
MVKKRGAVLLIVLVVLLTISLLGVTMMALFYNVLTSSRTELDRVRALYLAEAGIAQTVSAMRGQAGSSPAASGEEPADSADDAERLIPRTSLGGGYFEVYNDPSQSVIVSTGSSNNVKRTLQVKYDVY